MGNNSINIYGYDSKRIIEVSLNEHLLAIYA